LNQKLKKREMILPVFIFGILITGISIFYFVNKYTDKKRQELKSETVTPAVSQTDSIPEVKQILHPTPQPIVKAATVQTGIDPFEKAIKTFDSKDYTLSITLLEALQIEKLSSQQRTIRTSRLIQSYLNIGKLEKAANLARIENVADAQVYYQLAEEYLRLKQFDEAIAVSEKCYLNSTSLNVKKKAVMLQTRICESKYQLKPNRGNKNACHRAWSAYSAEFCNDSGSSRDCQEALEKISRYSE